MKIKQHKYFERLRSIFVFVVFLAASILPLASGGVAHAYGLVTTRSVEMSDSTTNATPVTYTITFTPNGGSIQGLIVDFCSTSAIIGDTCTLPTSFTVGTPTITGQSANISTYTTASSLNSGRTLKLTSTASAATVSGAVTFNITTVHNPNTVNTTFYARILTFDTTADTGSYTDTGANTGLVDAGGVAISTSNNITITAKVQETLTFCVYTGANCGAGGSTVTLGDTNGVLRTSGPFVDVNTQYDVATNAASGVAIRLKGDTLKTGSFSIASIGSSATSSSAGTSQFGLCTYQSTGAGLTPAAPYNNANCNTATQTAGTGSTGGAGTAQFALDTANTVSTYGQVIANKTAGTTSKGIIPFIGNISTSQQAGIYTTTLIFIATGIY